MTEKTLREAAQMALEALELTHCTAKYEQDCDVCNAVEALRAALALPDAEQVPAA